MTKPEEIRTLVVDDSPAALRAICSVVARQPQVKFVGAATNGQEALALARILQPDLVLLDLEMPVMNGIEATEFLRHDCPMCRIVVISVHDTPEMRKLCIDRGAVAFVAKDMIGKELTQVIKNIFVT